jgi:hypothetical protein
MAEVSSTVIGEVKAFGPRDIVQIPLRLTFENTGNTSATMISFEYDVKRGQQIIQRKRVTATVFENGKPLQTNINPKYISRLGVYLPIAASDFLSSMYGTGPLITVCLAPSYKTVDGEILGEYHCGAISEPHIQIVR